MDEKNVNSGKTLLIEVKSGKVLQVLNQLADISDMPEILTFTKTMSEGEFLPIKDQEEKYKVGDIVDFEFLLIQGNINSGARIVHIRKLEPSVEETQAYNLTTIAGIKGRHKIGDTINL
jgi:hypothetical protein